MKEMLNRGYEFCNCYDVDRDLQSIFIKGIKKMGFNRYGHKVLSDGSYQCDFENERFLLRPNLELEDDCNCGYEEANYESFGDYGGDIVGFHSVDCICSEGVNFWYKPKDIKISWTSEPFRSAYSNDIITQWDIEEIMQDCIDNFNKDRIIED